MKQYKELDCDGGGMRAILDRLTREGLSEGMNFGQRWMEWESQPYEDPRGKSCRQREQHVQRPYGRKEPDEEAEEVDVPGAHEGGT